jgi:hypothetical protein
MCHGEFYVALELTATEARAGYGSGASYNFW